MQLSGRLIPHEQAEGLSDALSFAVSIFNLASDEMSFPDKSEKSSRCFDFDK